MYITHGCITLATHAMFAKMHMHVTCYQVTPTYSFSVLPVAVIVTRDTCTVVPGDGVTMHCASLGQNSELQEVYIQVSLEVKRSLGLLILCWEVVLPTQTV